MSSLFIAIEGPNGVGKTTITRLLGRELTQRDGARPVHLTSEPTDTALGRLLRTSESVLQGRALALALAADRADHLETEVIPALDAGQHVITDRYVQSSMVLQRIDGLDLDEIWTYNQYVLPPDLSVYLDDASEVIAARLAGRMSRTRLEQVGGPAKERALYREAVAFLGRRQHRWRQHTVDCRGCSPGQVVAAILDRLTIPNSTVA